MNFPTTCAELTAQGYERGCYSRCKGCKESIEWWTTPSGQRIPMNFMPAPESPAVAHFATCPKAHQFKKEPHRCTPIYPTSTSQDSQPSLFSSESLSSQEPLSTDKHDEKNEGED